MMNFSRQPMYRSARAVPSAASSSASPFGRISTVRTVQIVLGCIAFLVMAINLFHIYPMFHAVDSDVMNKSHHRIIGNVSDVSADAADTMHHGVHKNLLEHKLSLRDHLEQRQQQVIDEANGIDKLSERIQERVGISSPIKNESSGKNRGLPTATATVVDKTSTSGRGQLKDILNNDDQKLARGYSGLPMEETPALVGAKRGTIDCDVDVNAMAYWNSPQGTRDEQFISPFKVTGKRKYITFEPDPGGFNNIRMSAEIVFVIAAATGRTLVLPPPQNIYLLTDITHTQKFDDFFPLYSESLKRRFDVISTKEFFMLEMMEKGGHLEIDDETQRSRLLLSAEKCDPYDKSETSCYDIYRFLRERGSVAPIKEKNCLIFDINAFKDGSSAGTTVETSNKIKQFCGARDQIYYGSEMAEPNILHFHTGDANEQRLLSHFYSTIYFTDPVVDNYMKRFVRDFIHYQDNIFCAAGKIVQLLQKEGMERGFKVDEEGAGGYSALHVRRGDLQFKEVKISGEEWYNNTAKLWQPKELLYIATDEKDKSFFGPLAKNYELRFLEDYFEKAGLDKLDRSLLGMVEIAVTSRGRLFVGTWHSTFSGYIMRLRGYYGVSKASNYYAYRPRQLVMHKWVNPDNTEAREFPIAWLGIDGDTYVLKDLEPNSPSPIGPIANISLLGKQSPRPIHLDRGFSGLPLEKTPALIGASRGSIRCDVDVSNLVYWNEPQGMRDMDFVSPFHQPASIGKTQYVTFWQDPGRFNNIRMSLEIILVFAAATGRTVVLPPTQNLRLEVEASTLDTFEEFYSFQDEEFKKRISVISMKQFIEREGKENGLLSLDENTYKRVLELSQFCENRKKSNIYCGEIFDIIAQHSSTKIPPLGTSAKIDTCLVFDESTFKSGKAVDRPDVLDFCGSRTRVYYTQELSEPDIIHFDTYDTDHRLLSHFYQFIYFTNPIIDNHFKRFVRDFMHYNDRILCAAGKIVRAIQTEAMQLGFTPDEEGGGGYSSLHVRRTDLQYPDVLLNEDKWWLNTRDLWKPRELLYVATDESDKRFFDNFVNNYHDVRFLDDYWDLAGLSSFRKEHLGMIDVMVASRGRVFVGTYYSTFSGYISRIRGYYGMSKYSTYYGWNPVKFAMQGSNFFANFNDFSREYPIGWVGIDGDERMLKDNEEEQNIGVEDAPSAGDGKNTNTTITTGLKSSEVVPEVVQNHIPEVMQTSALTNIESTSKILLGGAKNATNDPGVEDSQTLPSDHGIRSLEESMIKSLGFLPNEDDEMEVSGNMTLYLVFSTDCSPSQHWESYLLFFSAMRTKQPGLITRIASGCTEKETEEAREWHQLHISVMSNRFRIFFTPKFSTVHNEGSSSNGGDYKYFNKPFGVKYYLENSSDFGWDESAGKMTAVEDNAVVIIIDPDMIFMRPLTTDFGDSSVEFWKPFYKATERKKKVETGSPFGQTYAFSSKWMKFAELAGADSPALKVDERTAVHNYQVGPPYLATALDMHVIVRRWAELVPLVYKAKPELMSEMYAYSLAAADKGLPHEIVNSMMISVPNGYGEGWKMIDAIPNDEVCMTGILPNQSRHTLPPILHYCQSYGVGNVTFYKYLLDEDIFTCSKPLLVEPGDDAMSPNNAHKKKIGGEKEILDPKLHKRNAFAACAMTSIVNEASLFYKLHHCNNEPSNKENTLYLL